jgi:hypothetical protein
MKLIWSAAVASGRRFVASDDWTVEGIGGAWPAGDAAILVLTALYAPTALPLISIERSHAFGSSPWRQA